MRFLPAAPDGGACIARLLAAPLAFATASSAHAEDAVRVFEIAIRGGAVARDMRVLKATQHERVRIVWTVDTPLAVHLEGYDVSVRARPDLPRAMEFKAHAAGRFPVHAHAADAVPQGQGHAHGRGVLLRVEVHPK